ncbi:hypothetical protein THAOC_11678 [Thalassiosira oceanica]|uniref:Uncharacterized protein n=1 Tax=Thalassiosira oceanica TaxID=159749 RepID=K0SPR3_THAOC|nr:hypothetical protein THAOC_11678 [Thalassiosira oceanica]|mmetsp:Transcript_19879/g.45586  ORF Transcript_19879/g.45586 Transcript_19879/m.45586 type:complete len:229 (-) Transcript_19879:178-864(-)|eukprot:EJK67305.1 hypothetical protein THAOC_11678 [Thalassiosira oceanica]
MVKSSLLAAALCVGASAFTAPAVSNKNGRPFASLNLSRKDIEESGKNIAAAGVIASALVVGPMANAIELAAEAPSSSFTDTSSVLLSARSGGRAGGRARSMPRSSPPPSSGGTTVINKRTVIQAPPVVVGGGGYGYGSYGYGYDPTPGLVFGAVNAIGNGMREARQNDMIRTQQAELNASRMNEAEMAARIRQLEMQQNGGQQAQPQTIIVQPPQAGQPAAVAPAPSQ